MVHMRRHGCWTSFPEMYRKSKNCSFERFFHSAGQLENFLRVHGNFRSEYPGAIFFAYFFFENAVLCLPECFSGTTGTTATFRSREVSLEIISNAPGRKIILYVFIKLSFLFMIDSHETPWCIQTPAVHWSEKYLFRKVSQSARHLKIFVLSPFGLRFENPGSFSFPVLV